MRRSVTVAGAALSVAVAAATALVVPGAVAHAGTADPSGCRKVLQASAGAGNGGNLPFVVYRVAEGGDFTATWETSTTPLARNALVSCSFHDRNRNGRYDVARERVFVDRQSFDLAEDTGGRWPYGSTLTGVPEGAQVCNGTVVRSTPLGGGSTTSQSQPLTCFPVEPFFAE